MFKRSKTNILRAVLKYERLLEKYSEPVNPADYEDGVNDRYFKRAVTVRKHSLNRHKMRFAALIETGKEKTYHFTLPEAEKVLAEKRSAIVAEAEKYISTVRSKAGASSSGGGRPKKHKTKAERRAANNLAVKRYRRKLKNK